jgi:hypothetical protein
MIPRRGARGGIRSLKKISYATGKHFALPVSRGLEKV